MAKHEVRSAVGTLLVCLSVGGVACQKLDPNLATGLTATMVGGAGGGGGKSPSGGDGGSGGGGSPAVSCPTVRMQAFVVLQTNCSICHEAPGTPSLYSGPFNFILELDKLTSSSSSVGTKYVTKGRPDLSYIYLRVSGGTMPPAFRTQRPSTADVQVLNRWITSCIGDPTSPNGWPGPQAPADAGADAGGALESCGPTRPCPSGDCCVLNRCRANGSSCGPRPNPIPGQPDLLGLPGMCNEGSCETSDGGVACGKVGEPCCDLDWCTAAQASCLMTDLTMCSACGGAGQPCCKPNACLDGNACVGYGVGRVGTCQVCGGLDQPCCGSGAAALRTCDDTLTCLTVSDTDTKCVAGADGGTP